MILNYLEFRCSFGALPSLRKRNTLPKLFEIRAFCMVHFFRGLLTIAIPSINNISQLHFFLTFVGVVYSYLYLMLPNPVDGPRVLSGRIFRCLSFGIKGTLVLDFAAFGGGLLISSSSSSSSSCSSSALIT